MVCVNIDTSAECDKGMERREGWLCTCVACWRWQCCSRHHLCNFHCFVVNAAGTTPCHTFVSEHQLLHRGMPKKGSSQIKVPKALSLWFAVYQS